MTLVSLQGFLNIVPSYLKFATFSNKFISYNFVVILFSAGLSGRVL